MNHLVGRRRELDALKTWLAQAKTGPGRLVLCAGEPGIGKTRLAQELAGHALAGGTAVAWGRCAEDAPAYWPWRQVLKTIGADPAAVLSADRSEDRFRIFEQVTAAIGDDLVIVLDDIHWADEPSLRVLGHVAGQLPDLRVLLFATFRDSARIPDLLRSPGVGRIDLRGFDVHEVRESGITDAETVRQVTGGNPLFVREIARAIEDGTWRPDRPPQTVRDIVRARLDRVSAETRALVQAAAVVGRDFEPELVADVVDLPVQDTLPLIDEAIAAWLFDSDRRFVHALTRDAVEASLTTADRTRLHRRVAVAIGEHHRDSIEEHLTDIAQHWAKVHGAQGTAREWTIRAAQEATRRLAYEEGVRLYEAALAIEDDCRTQIARGRAAYLAGNLKTCVEAAEAAARKADHPDLLAEAALVLEAAVGAGVNAVATALCEEALDQVTDIALEARLRAQRSHLAFYAGEQDRLDELSTLALHKARESGNDEALVEALRARQEACPGPSGLSERFELAAEMLELAQRTGNARTAMWGRLWRLHALVEQGRLRTAAEELPALHRTVDRVGGPVSAWHRDLVTACVAQARAATPRPSTSRGRPISGCG